MAPAWVVPSRIFPVCLPDNLAANGLGKPASLGFPVIEGRVGGVLRAKPAKHPTCLPYHGDLHRTKNLLRLSLRCSCYNKDYPINLINYTGDVMTPSLKQSEFMNYLLGSVNGEVNSSRLPSLSELSGILEVSVARLREQLEVARALGFVEARPRTGIRRLPYSFLPAVRQSLFYAIELEQENFNVYNDLCNHIEAAYYDQAVRLLEPEDVDELKALVARAWEKLNAEKIQIPHLEHRLLHLKIFQRLDNPFVLGLLEAYWEAYEASGLNQYADYDYLRQVWGYHQKIVDGICSGDYAAGLQA
jgi:DNA-binding FadR family transcriptional regulator